MKKIVLLFFYFSCFSLFAQATQSPGFVENKGQLIDQYGKPNPKVKYLLNTSGLNVQLRANGFSYDLYETKKKPLTKKQIQIRKPFRGSSTQPDYTLDYSFHRIDIDFENCNANAQLFADGKSADYDNYYNIPAVPQGINHVHHFQKVTYRNIYDGVDVVFLIPQDHSKPVEYNFIINPGGDINSIRLRFNGVKTELADTKIRLNVRFGQMEETLPLSWEDTGSGKTELPIRYKKIKENLYGFESFQNLNDKKIIIDPVPVRLWGTYYGGERDENTLSLEKDASGTVYLCGSTSSKDFIATSGAHQIAFGSLMYYGPYLYITDGFIAKFDSDGNKLWSTFYGGQADDSVNDIAVAGNGKIGFCGDTWSADNIATTGAFKDFKSGPYGEMFFGMLNPDGTREWCSYYGDNSGRSFMKSILIDSNNNLFLGGMTTCSGYIATPGSFQSTHPDAIDFDGFIAKFSASGIQAWGTYFGGSREDSFEDMVFDSDTNVVAVGYTSSANNISTPSSFQPAINNPNSYDGFAVSFNTSGARNWGTYFGGNQDDKILRVKCANHMLYFSGDTESDDMATANAFEITNQSVAVGHFISKFSIQNQQKIWLSYNDPKITDIDVNPNGEIYIVGESSYADSSNLSTPNAFNTTPNGFGNYIRKINDNCQIVWGTYLGNTGFILQPFVKFFGGDVFYVSGTAWTSTITDNFNLTTANSSQPQTHGEHEAYINKFKDCIAVSTITSNSPICMGSSIQLTASGGTNYAWTGPSGFTSNLQNPSVPNASGSNAGQYTCTITGTGGCDGTSNVSVVVGDNVKPVPDVAQLPTITGDCTTTLAFPTATDNCAGPINATTTDALNFTLPGTYTIHWSYTDGNGNTELQNQTVIINAVALPVITSPQIFCIQQNATLASLLITGQNIKWYDASTGGNLLMANTVLVNGTNYYASQTIGNCESTRIPVTVNIQDTPAPTGNALQTLCSTQNPTVATLAVNGNALVWYANALGTAILPNTTAVVDGATYYASQVLNGCESINRLAVTVQLISSLSATDYSETICDDLNDGIETISLPSYNGFLISNTANCTFEYYRSLSGATNQVVGEAIAITSFPLQLGSNLIYVRITSSNGCNQIVQLNLTLISKPKTDIPDIIPICDRSTVTIDAGAGFDSYLWSTGSIAQSITVSQAGNYWVTITKTTGAVVCSSTKNFNVVLSNTATITSVETQDWTDASNEITVQVSGLGDYEYSIDGLHYQTSPVFEELASGIYKIYVKDRNGCGIVNEDVVLLMYPKFFTPNGDGINDLWKVKFSAYEPGLTVSIFDRYGKLLKTMDHADSWDGKYDKKELPSDDYWFVVTRASGKTSKGHFSMKR